MAKIILTVDGAVVKEVALIKERVTIGRRLHNDMVIEHPAISGEHAVIVTLREDSFVEDLRSTNGTKINGQPVKKHFLRDNDVIELGAYKIKFVAGECGGDRRVAVAQGREDGRVAGEPAPTSDTTSQQSAIIEVLNGQSAGKAITLSKPLTTIGRPGIQVAVVTHRKQDYFITHVEGSFFPLVNGDSIGENARLLRVDDVIDLSGTRMVFRRLE